MQRYYFSTGGDDVEGPISLELLQHLRHSGALAPGTQVCAEGSETWENMDVFTPPRLPAARPAVQLPRIPKKVLLLCCVGGFLFLLFLLGIVASHDSSPRESVLESADPLLTRLPVAVDKDAFDEFIRYASASNNTAKELLVASGRVFRVPVPVRVQVLSGGLASTKISISEGEFIDRTGFVPSEWVGSRAISAQPK